ncbi:MAG TPA: 2-amino-3,7-dideoxy-D-threo-hept-6-ulosonate synthase [bacterium]|nr:2-amino-3,7-dideoxy-D-threo-hept-6-ulosonate synthase [bacterium]HOL46642.1 2-amino-3,7-dideoxy-D-threo-hept-6-ulosonate synthase [bacterium]HPQ17787.1 2-amino-3,7-dideoxy-D-threo-hept-6-ulosonate synthase [bacterium]
MIGKAIRLERIINRNTKKTVIVPMDHGITVGPIPGLVNMQKTVSEIVKGGANAIILHKGIVTSGHRRSGKDIGLILHLSASTNLSPDPNEKVIVSTVEEAIVLGADAVSIHINLGADTEAEMLKNFGMIAKDCMKWAMPLVAMMYTRGKKIEREDDVKVVKHAARVAAEMGADIVKVSYTGSAETFYEVVQGCPIPVVIAGGEKIDSEEEFLKLVKDAMSAGAGGVSIGRNAFQHKEPRLMVRTISNIVHNKISVEEAIKILNKNNRS